MYFLIIFLLFGAVHCSNSNSSCQGNNSINQNSAIYLFSHGAGDCHKQAYLYTKNHELALADKLVDIGDRHLVDGPMVTFDYPDACESFWMVDRSAMHFGQEKDLGFLQEAYDKTCYLSQTSLESPCNIVMLGMSRGASALLNFMALNNPEEVKALVLESPFDTPICILKSFMDRFYMSWIPGLLTIGSFVMQKFLRGYNPDGLMTIDLVATITSDLPILLICSKKDTVVPATSTAKIYKKLIATGHTNVHILVLNSGIHSRLFAQEDGDIYQNVTHAFFRHYNLPHDPTLAQEGQERFERCQPTREELKILLK